MSAGKVGNLRAMFEQRVESSPPERGRSPGIPAEGSGSPRPLSKVRTSFVAVEKDGRIGLQSTNSRDSSVSSHRPGDGTTTLAATAPATLPDKSNARAESMEVPATRTNLKDQPIPESPRVERGDANPGAAPSQALGTGKGDVSTGKVASLQSKSDVKDSKPNGGGVASTAAAKANGAGKQGNVNSTSDGSHLKNKPTAAKVVPKPTERPVTTKTARPAAKPASHAKPTEKKPTTTSRTEKSNTSIPISTQRPTSSAAPVQKLPPLLPNPSSGTGFVKPKVESPTRPVKLPPGLTSHTAASGSKVNGPLQGQPVSRAGVTHPEGRSPSRAGAAVASTARTKSLSSTVSRPRPSVGLPPKQAAKDHPPARKEKDVDEGFLSRMTRPTQSSSSKTNDKTLTTPPKKLAESPATKHVAHRSVPYQFEPKPVKKVIKAAPASGPASVSSPQPVNHEAKPDPKTQQSTVNKTAAAAEQAATAEQAVAVAKEGDGAESLTLDPTAGVVPEKSETAELPVAQVSHEEANTPASAAEGDGAPVAVQEAETNEVTTVPTPEEDEAQSARVAEGQAEVIKPEQPLDDEQAAKYVNGGLEQHVPDEGKTEPALGNVVEGSTINHAAGPEPVPAEDQVTVEEEMGVPAAGALGSP